MKIYKGNCFCGSVQFELYGEPLLMGYCHCNSCREWSGSPVNAFTLWKLDQLKINKGKENVSKFSKTLKCIRNWCKDCGGNLFAELTEKGFIDVFAGTINNLEFTPQMHVHYQEKVLQIKDGLPKFKNLPGNSGDSDELLPE